MSTSIPRLSSNYGRIPLVAWNQSPSCHNHVDLAFVFVHLSRPSRSHYAVKSAGPGKQKSNTSKTYPSIHGCLSALHTVKTGSPQPRLVESADQPVQTHIRGSYQGHSSQQTNDALAPESRKKSWKGCLTGLTCR